MYRHEERGELLPCSSQQSSKSKKNDYWGKAYLSICALVQYCDGLLQV